MDLDNVFYILIGSTFGIILRLYIRYIFKTNKLFYFNEYLIVNVLSSLFLGFFIALSLNNENIILFFTVGFLGCFSTFSSFIYQLFNLIQKREFLTLLIYYLEVLMLSFLFFSLGYSINLITQS